MNHRIIYPTLCLSALLLLTGCLPKDRSFVPVTGAEDAFIPALIEQARGNVLEYVISSSRLAAIPPSADWQLDQSEPVEGKYRFRSGDWLMVIWLANADEENQQVVIINKVESAYWCGHVQPDGHVVDTSHTP